MPYITQSNSKKILYQIHIEDLSPKELDNLYKQRLWLLSHKEKLWLSGAKKLFGQHEEFLSSKYIKQKPIDTKRYVYEGLLPAYHADRKCERLNSTYDNFEIPEEIKSRGDEEIEKFRKFFKENKNLFETDQKRFLIRLEATFFLKNAPNKISSSNSGIASFDNIDVSTLESDIDELMEQAKIFYFQSSLHQNTIDLKGDFAYKLAKEANKNSIIYMASFI